MNGSANVDLASERILVDLIHALHQGAPAADFSSQMAKAESLPGAWPAKASLVECVRMAMAIRNRLELQEQRERGLLTVIESAQDLSGHLDLMSLLRAIVSRARNLLGSHVAWLSVYDSDADEFKVQVTEGALTQSTGKMTASRNYGVASLIMSTRLPFTTPDYLHDKQFPHDPMLDEAFRAEDIVSLVGAPLLSDNDVVGLLFIADRYHRPHTALEVSILCTLATHAAVAIKNAKAFEQASIALKNGDIARAELERHTRNVQAAAEAHEQLTALLAHGASLATLCQSVAQLLDGSVLVVDEAFQIISQGSAATEGDAALKRYTPYGDSNSAIVKAARDSRKAGRSMLAYKGGDGVCRVVSVIGGDDVLGAVLLFRRDDLNAISIRTFERSATVIGILLLSEERSEVNKSRDVTTLLRGLLSSHQNELVTRDQAGRFDLDLAQPLSLILVETDDPKAVYMAKQLRADTALSAAVLDEIDGIVALVCQTTSAQHLLQACTDLVDGEFGGNYRGVLSRPVATAQELPALYATLRRALVVARRLGVNRQILGQNELVLYSVLFESHDQTGLDAFLTTTIGMLVAQDRKRGSELTATLLCYFDSNQNARLAAKRLNIHVNTARQRLTTIEGMLGHWGNATRTLELHMALRLWRLSKDGDTPAR